MPMTKTSRRIVITGAASGLGRGLAQIFAVQGHRLVLLDLNAKGLEQTCQSLPGGAAAPRVQVLDVTSAEQVRACFSALGEEPVDVLINNAGLQHVSPVGEFSEERWDLLLDVMLKGAFLLTQTVLPGMRRQGFGRIVNIGSIHSLVGSPFKSAYVAAKHGLVGLSKVVALETGDVDITINTICPAYVRTPLVDAQIRAQTQAHGISEQDVIDTIMLKPMPKKAFITMEEIAAAVVFLMSREARNITGQTLVIDGGWTAQ